MVGYCIVFDRENMNLGWKEPNCTDEVLSNTRPINKSHSLAVSPAIAVNYMARPEPSSNTGRFSPSQSFRMKPSFAYMVLLFSLIAIFSFFLAFPYVCVCLN
ncbi:aspartyl protease family protein 1-like [Lathyrus oleraceus]|uniref:aspartyl protease family protein 1-like n=1 Tax=Pisum sativum TaxID=3888 RepID=UPI0021D0295E|nr:aspartyl protease family protein 1-like [Pisum sativum]